MDSKREAEAESVVWDMVIKCRVLLVTHRHVLPHSPCQSFSQVCYPNTSGYEVFFML
jgi:hypothetical protein